MKKFKKKEIKNLIGITGGEMPDRWHTYAPGGGWWYWDFKDKNPHMPDK